MKTTQQLMLGMLATAIFGIVGLAAALPNTRHTAATPANANSAAKSHCDSSVSARKPQVCEATRTDQTGAELHTTVLPEIHVVPDPQ
ncbi:MAG: hypothetical protein ABI411_18605 [Tahibacter sp.]